MLVVRPDRPPVADLLDAIRAAESAVDRIWTRSWWTAWSAGSTAPPGRGGPSSPVVSSKYLPMVAAGASTGEIAARLELSVNTVRHHHPEHPDQARCAHKTGRRHSCGTGGTHCADGAVSWSRAPFVRDRVMRHGGCVRRSAASCDRGGSRSRSLRGHVPSRGEQDAAVAASGGRGLGLRPGPHGGLRGNRIALDLAVGKPGTTTSRALRACRASRSGAARRARRAGRVVFARAPSSPDTCTFERRCGGAAYSSRRGVTRVPARLAADKAVVRIIPATSAAGERRRSRSLHPRARSVSRSQSAATKRRRLKYHAAHMKKLRVLVLMHHYLVPPADAARSRSGGPAR